jgi:hypothetical protein
MPVEKLVYQATVRTTIEAVAVGSIGLGAGLAFGGPARFAAPSLATARAMPGAQWTWALIIAGFGIVTLAGARAGWRRRVVMTGLAGQGLIFLFFDVSLWVTAAKDPATPLTGCVVYLMVAFVCAVLYGGGHGLEAAQHAAQHAEENSPP